MVKAVFFDLFFTLADPRYADENEYDVIGISAAVDKPPDKWEKIMLSADYHINDLDKLLTIIK